jgi:NAD(P)-dependent dehydrogenase (short-subunit alcohol dehydrogenase family)
VRQSVADRTRKREHPVAVKRAVPKALVARGERRSLFSGQVVVVTGGVQGIGEGIALYLASAGAAVAIIDVDSAKGLEAERRLSRQGLAVRFWHCDLNEPESISASVDAIWRKEGRIDVLVNNAAAHGPRVSLLEYSVRDWESVLRTNLTGTFWLTREVARRMIAHQIAGSIVNILAIQSEVPIAGYGPYVASKGGLEALTRAMAVELSAHNIRANGVMLGAIYSGSTRGPGLLDSASVADFENVPPTLDQAVPNLVGRMGRPSDVARAVAFLASPESSYLTGAVVVVDGGRLLNRGTDPFSPPPADRPRGHGSRGES